jgi:hypothetical protein
VKVNWFVVVFNNFYSRLHDLFAPIRLGKTRDNIEFKFAQVVNILLQNWFLVDTIFILLELDEEEEGVATSIPKV